MLMSPEYRALNVELHNSDARYGTSGGIAAPMARPVADWGRLPILDFGCGRQMLAHTLGPAYRVTGYDPALDGLDATPEPCAVVVCTEVLEHVEPDYLDAVLTELRRVTDGFGLFTIALKEARKVLSDGRNAHLIVESKDWWLHKLQAHGFKIEEHGDGFNKEGVAVGMWVKVT